MALTGFDGFITVFGGNAFEDGTVYGFCFRKHFVSSSNVMRKFFENSGKSFLKKFQPLLVVVGIRESGPLEIVFIPRRCLVLLPKPSEVTISRRDEPMVS